MVNHSIFFMAAGVARGFIVKIILERYQDIFAVHGLPVGSILLRPMRIEVDIEDVHRWVKHDSAVFWHQDRMTLQDLTRKYAEILQKSPSGVLIGEQPNGAKVCMLMPYLLRQDEVGVPVDAGPDDWGCHVFMVPSPVPIRHMTYQVYIAMQHYIFLQMKARRLVHQPEIHNRKVAARFVQSDYVDQGVVHLGGKSVRIYSMTIDQFAARQLHESPAPVALPSSQGMIALHHLVGRVMRKAGLRSVGRPGGAKLECA